MGFDEGLMEIEYEAMFELDTSSKISFRDVNVIETCESHIIRFSPLFCFQIPKRSFVSSSV